MLCLSCYTCSHVPATLGAAYAPHQAVPLATLWTSSRAALLNTFRMPHWRTMAPTWSCCCCCVSTMYAPEWDTSTTLWMMQHGRKDGVAAGYSAVPLAHALSEDWQSVPDDVLQAMVAYLRPADVAIARLVCRHWRRMLSCYTPALTLPTRYAASAGLPSLANATHTCCSKHRRCCNNGGVAVSKL